MGEGRIEIHGLCRSFGRKPALHPLELEVEPGRVTGLLGPNGSGKSTLLRLLLGLLRPDSGTARVDGVELAGDGIAIRRCTTYTPGEISLYGELRGADHLAWFLRGRGRPALERARRIAESLELPLAKRVWAYSHGMKRQLMFAAAMGPEVRVRILDEASEGLDPSKRSVVLDLLDEDARRGTTILLSSHHLGEVDRACSTFVFLNEGRLVSVESAAEVRRRASRIVRLRFSADLPTYRREALLAALRAMPGVEAELQDSLAIVRLEAEDPRDFLAEFAGRRELPPPESLSFGEVSLTELYRALYGVEAC